MSFHYGSTTMQWILNHLISHIDLEYSKDVRNNCCKRHFSYVLGRAFPMAIICPANFSFSLSLSVQRTQKNCQWGLESSCMQIKLFEPTDDWENPNGKINRKLSYFHIKEGFNVCHHNSIKKKVWSFRLKWLLIVRFTFYPILLP